MTQLKLEELESGVETAVKQQQQKLTGMIAEQNLDKALDKHHHHHHHHQQQQQQQQQQQEPTLLDSFLWYHGNISRDIAVNRVAKFSMEDG